MTPEQEIAASLARFSPEVARLAETAIRCLDGRLPGATRFLYDKANAVVLGYGPSERPSDAVLSIGVYSRWVNLYFLDGAELADRDRLLQGSGSRVRFVRLHAPADLEKPTLGALIKRATDAAVPRFPSARRGITIVKQRRGEERARRRVRSTAAFTTQASTRRR